MAYWKKEWFYGVMGSVGAIALLLYVIFTLQFLVRELGRSLNPNLIKTPEVVRFNLDKMKELKIPGI
ncbi:MAG: hypothetical protein Q7R85_04415 [bacterium]|nr:hypothetical protein [bacterium]